MRLKKPKFPLHNEIHDIDFSIPSYVDFSGMENNEEFNRYFKTKDKVIGLGKALNKEEKKQFDYDGDEDSDYVGVDGFDVNLTKKLAFIHSPTIEINVDLFVNSNSSYKKYSVYGQEVLMDDPWVALKFKFDYVMSKNASKENRRKHLKGLFEVANNLLG